MLVTNWVRDQIVAANQNSLDLNEHGWWIFERWEVFNGFLAVISSVPIEFSNQEIKQGLIDGSRSLLEPLQVVGWTRVQHLKRREISPEDPKISTCAPGKSAQIIFPT